MKLVVGCADLGIQAHRYPGEKLCAVCCVLHRYSKALRGVALLARRQAPQAFLGSQAAGQARRPALVAKQHTAAYLQRRTLLQLHTQGASARWCRRSAESDRSLLRSLGIAARERERSRLHSTACWTPLQSAQQGPCTARFHGLRIAPGRPAASQRDLRLGTSRRVLRAVLM